MEQLETIKEDKETTYVASRALEKQLETHKLESSQKHSEMTESLESLQNTNQQLTSALTAKTVSS